MGPDSVGLDDRYTLSGPVDSSADREAEEEEAENRVELVSLDDHPGDIEPLGMHTLQEYPLD
jgi:hypothetical protein